MTEGLPRARAILAQCIIEITDREGLSDVVMMADVIRSHRNPRRVLQRAAHLHGIG